jgi:hypothetical protein
MHPIRKAILEFIYEAYPDSITIQSLFEELESYKPDKISSVLQDLMKEEYIEIIVPDIDDAIPYSMSSKPIDDGVVLNLGYASPPTTYKIKEKGINYLEESN